MTERDCDSKNGITVGIVDTIINALHLLSERGWKSLEVQEALKDLIKNDTLMKILYGDSFVGRDKPMLKEFKEHTLLTDGKSFIYLGWIAKKDWTPQNNYGRKWRDYFNCSCYPANLTVSGTRVFLDSAGGQVPGLWLQDGHHLQYFRPIDEKLVNPEILKKLFNENSKGS